MDDRGAAVVVVVEVLVRDVGAGIIPDGGDDHAIVVEGRVTSIIDDRRVSRRHGRWLFALSGAIFLCLWGILKSNKCSYRRDPAAIDGGRVKIRVRC